jgi:hypothetical protein
MMRFGLIWGFILAFSWKDWEETWNSSFRIVGVPEPIPTGHYPNALPLGQCSLLTIFFIIVSGVRLSPLGTAATTGLLYQPQMIDDGDCGEIGGIKVGRRNRNTRRKPTPAPLCQPQIPHDQTRARTRTVAVGSQRLTAWVMARPSLLTKKYFNPCPVLCNKIRIQSDEWSELAQGPGRAGSLLSYARRIKL